MNATLLATLGGVLVVLLWGVSDWLTAKSSRQHSPLNVAVAMRLPQLAIGAALIFAASSLPSPEEAMILCVAGVFFFLTYLMFIKALSLGEAGIVVPIANAYPIVTLVLTSVFLEASFTVIQIGAVGVVVLGAILVGFEKLSFRKQHKHLSVALTFAVITALFWGISFAALEPVIETLSWQAGVGLLTLTEVACALLLWSFVNRKDITRQFATVIKNKIGMLAGVMLLIGTMVFYISSQVVSGVVVVATIAAASPLVTAVLAWAFDHEKIILIKRIGAVVIVAGVVLLNLQ